MLIGFDKVNSLKPIFVFNFTLVFSQGFHVPQPVITLRRHVDANPASHCPTLVLFHNKCAGFGREYHPQCQDIPLDQGQVILDYPPWLQVTLILPPPVY